MNHLVILVLALCFGSRGLCDFAASGNCNSLEVIAPGGSIICNMNTGDIITSRCSSATNGSFGVWVNTTQLTGGKQYSFSSNNNGTTFDTVIEIYDDRKSESECLAVDDDGGQDYRSVLVFTAPSTKVYDILVHGYKSGYGKVNLTLSEIIPLDFLSAEDVSLGKKGFSLQRDDLIINATATRECPAGMMDSIESEWTCSELQAVNEFLTPQAQIPMECGFDSPQTPLSIPATLICSSDSGSGAIDLECVGYVSAERAVWIGLRMLATMSFEYDSTRTYYALVRPLRQEKSKSYLALSIGTISGGSGDFSVEFGENLDISSLLDDLVLYIASLLYLAWMVPVFTTLLFFLGVTAIVAFLVVQYRHIASSNPSAGIFSTLNARIQRAIQDNIRQLGLEDILQVTNVEQVEEVEDEDEDEDEGDQRGRVDGGRDGGEGEGDLEEEEGDLIIEPDEDIYPPTMPQFPFYSSF